MGYMVNEKDNIRCIELNKYAIIQFSIYAYAYIRYTIKLQHS